MLVRWMHIFMCIDVEGRLMIPTVIDVLDLKKKSALDVKPFI